MGNTITISGAKLVLECLDLLDSGTIFGYPGGAVLPLYDALNDSQVKTVLVRHEQGAALAANGYGRVTGLPGFCVSTSGPGGTNLVTGIADAFADSVPMLAITGQVGSGLIGTSAFQEVDITGIAMPITKGTFLIRSIEEIPEVLTKAYHLALEGRKGPVLIDIPKDIQAGEAQIPADWKTHFQKPRPDQVVQIDKSEWDKALELGQAAQKPLIIAGQGVYLSDAVDEVRDFVEKEQIPLISTIHGIGILEHDHEMNFGWLGMHGMYYANIAVQECDLIIALGIRFDDRITGKLDTFAPKAKVVHIDIDPAENAKLVAPLSFIHSDLKYALQHWPTTLNEQNQSHRMVWQSYLDDLRRQYPLYNALNTERFTQIAALQVLNQYMDPDAYIATDVGQHQMWAGQYLNLKQRRFITSGGSGTMGFCLPAAMGIQEARPEEEVWAISGDGSFMMNLQEMMTCVQENYPIKILVLDNAYLGMVRQWQEQFYKNRLNGVNLSNPDFSVLAKAFGMPTFQVHSEEDLATAIEQAQAIQGPVLIHAVVVKDDKVLPMVPPGKSLSETLYYTDFLQEYPLNGQHKIKAGKAERAALKKNNLR